MQAKRHLLAVRWLADDGPLKWFFAGVPMMTHLLLYVGPLPHQLKKRKKNVVKVGAPLTKLSGSAHVGLLKFCSNDDPRLNLTL